jgi:hypothetical protein
MACPKNLRTDLLTGANTGGAWTYNGFNANIGATPAAPTVYPQVAGTAIPLNLNNSAAPVIPGGDNPSVTTDAADIGFHFFTYNVAIGDCTDSQVVILQVLPAVDAGADFNLSLCENGSSVVIYDEWVTNGTNPPLNIAGTTEWASASASSAYVPGSTADDITDDTFDPSLAAIGTYTYVFTVSATGQESGYTINCTDCTKTATVTISVVQAPVAGTAQTIAVCNA